MGKDDRYVGLTKLPLLYAECLEVLEPQLPGNMGVCPGLYKDIFTFTYSYKPLLLLVVMVIGCVMTL